MEALAQIVVEGEGVLFPLSWEKIVERHYKHRLKIRTKQVVQIPYRLAATVQIPYIAISGSVSEIEEVIAETVTSPFEEEVIQLPEDAERVARKIREGSKLNEEDEWFIKEVAESSGWRREDIVKELTIIQRNDPEGWKEKEELYIRIHEQYLREAEKYFKEKNYPQAAEKVWGAITALIKAVAAKRRIPIRDWHHRKLYNFVGSNIEEDKRKLFWELLEKGGSFHNHFYEHDREQYVKDNYQEVLGIIREIRKQEKI